MLTRLIAHQISKQQHSTNTTITLRPTVLPIDNDLAVNLLEQLRESFTKRNPVSGRFKTIDGTQPRFQQSLIGYLQNSTDESFVQFSSTAMRLLEERMSQQQLATGGYVIFAEFRAGGTLFLMTALLSTTAKPSFDSNLNLVSSISLDLDHLRHGARFRTHDVASNAEGGVHFISQQQSGVSEYFLEFIGSEEVTRPEVQANRIFTAINSWIDEQGLDEDVRWGLMGRAYNYWQTSRAQQQSMTLSGLANSMLPDNPAPLLAHFGQEERQLAGEFIAPPPNSMKKFIQFSFNAQGLKLQFDRNRWESRIDINREDRTLTISDIPEPLIAALSQELSE